MINFEDIVVGHIFEFKFNSGGAFRVQVVQVTMGGIELEYAGMNGYYGRINIYDWVNKYEPALNLIIHPQGYNIHQGYTLAKPTPLKFGDGVTNPTNCNHKWKAIHLMRSTVYDCELCGAKK